MCPKNNSFFTAFYSFHLRNQWYSNGMERLGEKNVCFCNTETEIFFKNLQTRHKKHFDRQIFILKWAN